MTLIFFIIKKILLFFLRFCFLINLHSLTISIIRFYILFRSSKIKKEKVGILSINNIAFRRDTNYLRKNFNLIIFPDFILNFIFSVFFPVKFRRMLDSDFYNSKDLELLTLRNNYRKYLDLLCSIIQKEFCIEIIISPHFRYKNQFDMIKTFKKYNVKFFCIFRESLAAVGKDECDVFIKKYKKFKNFEGDVFVAPNKKVDHCMKKMNILKNSQIKTIGLLRMDSLKNLPMKEKKNILFFSFGYYSPFLKDQNTGRTFHNKILRKFAELSKKYPQYNFIIRCKKTMYKNNIKWLKENRFLVKNLSVDYESNLHSILKETKLVFGIQSTALLEASILRLPVILTVFKEFRSSNFYDDYFLRNYFHLFDVCYDEKEMENIFRQRVSNFKISDNILKGRLKLFDREVSTLPLNSIERFSNLVYRFR